jgi:3'-phosphoadenosine 5'-phosphosulfate sulfotransferase (PAPS reductase)/FAD synthetase
LAEVEPREYVYLITPTGDELPDMLRHWERIECLLGQKLTRVSTVTLNELVQIQNMALPSHRMRYCTRMLKIQPCLEWMKAHQPATLYVGLRADEEERRGIYSADVTCRFPLREWGWGKREVWAYLQEREIVIPRRTDCARCFGQRLSEWYDLWRYFPEIYADAEAQEIRGTWRSPTRDAWPASLRELRAEFEKGRRPRGVDDQLGLFDFETYGRCRVCTM